MTQSKTPPSPKGKKIKKSKRALFRSGLERKISIALKRKKIEHSYESLKIKYELHLYRVYTPDFVVTTKSGKTIIIEAKGIWDETDRKKHLIIKQQYPDLDIRFIFSNSKTKIRKGSQTSYADICNGLGRGDYKGITWQFADKKIPQEWLEE